MNTASWIFGTLFTSTGILFFRMQVWINIKGVPVIQTPDPGLWNLVLVLLGIPLLISAIGSEMRSYKIPASVATSKFPVKRNGWLYRFNKAIHPNFDEWGMTTCRFRSLTIQSLWLGIPWLISKTCIGKPMKVLLMYLLLFCVWFFGWIFGYRPIGSLRWSWVKKTYKEERDQPVFKKRTKKEYPYEEELDRSAVTPILFMIGAMVATTGAMLLPMIPYLISIYGKNALIVSGKGIFAVSLAILLWKIVITVKNSELWQLIKTSLCQKAQFVD